ncbi:peptidase M1-like protein [Pedobacter psychrotolerans]|uniref:Peptidase M1 n=1 Tax=Pedobacter psychrotolerans TaxID=1843235 RepID=A0A4R2HMS9_9SPHI|nr:M1 family metallopeptidase [Pedobacter psychrotolerans]TCO29135.1 peptidase M1-like protein [Pedobacter psychrotolerans]GGE54442.1 peptidase M1 [Pedobacter psychrotolerans]
MKKLLILFALALCVGKSNAQMLGKNQVNDRADTLRGTLTPLRTCYDINYYHLDVKIDIDQKSVGGSNEFAFTATQDFTKLQFDLFSNLKVEKVRYKGMELPFTREYNAVFVTFPKAIKKGSKDQFTVFYSGNPVVAKNAPWDGGFIFKKDSAGNPFVSVACQGLGASVWWPNKDHQSDEVDSMLISISVPKTLQEISNGRLRSTVDQPDGYKQYNWFVSNPINNYDVTFYIGKYAHWQDSYAGENGNLSIDYWALQVDSAKARPHWDADVKPMLKCFEYWFGPYPWYKDGYKLVQAPHLGMEHQSAVAYGNQFKKGYLGRDLSGTGHGLKWDFITIHESGHEWFGNNITSKDIADMWIHEGFTNYSETLFTECTDSKKSGEEYVIGIRRGIENDTPIIGPYGVNKEGSSDMYPKGANLIHTIRQLINNDEKFRQILRGLNKTFYHKTVTTAEIENYIAKQSGLKLDKVFDQYLRHSAIPVLAYKINAGVLSYRWITDVKNFDMPIKVTLKADEYTLIKPTNDWKTIKVDPSITADNFKSDPQFYIKTKKE